RGGQFEYALRTLNSLVAQRRNLLRPKFYAMISDLLRFNARAEDLADDPAMTIRDLLGELGTGDWFRDHYLLPFSGAIWSTPTRDILDFPAAALVRFFRNHALLGLRGQHKWHTVRGGSVEYVRRLEAVLAERGVTVRTNTPIVSVRRMPVGVEVRADREGPDVFDEIVLATHADVSLKLLSDPSEAETRALSGIRFQDNHAILHADPSVMPQRQACWSSWNYAGQGGERDPIGITYWMNSLQPIPKDDPLFVTLNATREIRDDLIYDATTFRHPMYDRAIFDAQARLREMNGKRHTWFCGAWMKYGFHEDGCASGLEAAEAIVAQESLQVAA
ncbi:MAG: FAD-dependent oxidoreductase, partial [Pseudomonadota bacterium]